MEERYPNNEVGSCTDSDLSRAMDSEGSRNMHWQDDFLVRQYRSYAFRNGQSRTYERSEIKQDRKQRGFGRQCLVDFGSQRVTSRAIRDRPHKG